MEEKAFQATLQFSTIKNGTTVSYNYTFRHDTRNELQESVAWAETRLPSKSFPDDTSVGHATAPAQAAEPVNLGVCKYCGAANKWSTKSNKPYCSALCWTKGKV